MLYYSPGNLGLAKVEVRQTLDGLDIDLSEEALKYGWNGRSKIAIEFIVDPNVKIGSSLTTKAAIVTGNLPEGSEVYIINHGYIVGRGGTGGYGVTNTSPALGGAGGNGGDAIKTDVLMYIDNKGTIAGGGGGGSGSANPAPSGETYDDPGGGGGGGAGYLGGAPGNHSSIGHGIRPGWGTLVSGGRAGYSWVGDGKGSAVPAGAGGSLGYPGGRGQAGGYPGRAGNYIVNNHLVEWITEGIRLGGSY